MKLLYFYPENPLSHNQGNNLRAYQLLQYFKFKGFQVDFVAQESHIKNAFTLNDIETLTKDNLIRRGTLLKRRKRSGLKYAFSRIVLLYKSLFNNYKKVFDRIRFGQIKDLKTFIAKESYDIVIISYAYNYRLIDEIDFGKAIKILDTHDFLSAQFNRPDLFNKEISIANLFDYVWSISIEEDFLYSQFLNKKSYLIPHANTINKCETTIKSEIDVIYVASKNHHNIVAINWFMDSVLPLLNPNINITIIGKITEVVKASNNVICVPFAEQLEPFYQQSKIAICPMFTGTGLKIKVVEALSFGLPVVCNKRGVDGLLNKTSNGCLVTNKANEFADYINKLMANQDFYDKNKTEAVSFYNQTLSTSSVYKQLDTFFEDAI